MHLIGIAYLVILYNVISNLLRFRSKHTHTHTDIYMYVCVCVCVDSLSAVNETKTGLTTSHLCVHITHGS
jgi:hypothetical protein